MNTEQFDGHTPGPWVAKFDEHGVEGSLVVEGNRDDGAFGFGWEVGCQSPLWVGESNKNMPDARLIAAAPDLLAEVKRLQLIVHELLKDADHDTHIWFHSNGWCEDLRQPCAVCESRSDEE